MKSETELLTAVDFFEKLQQDKLDTKALFSILGMVKKSGGEEKTIQFAPGGNCSSWITIPLEFIEHVEVIKTIPCKDHTHPLVKLNMKTPATPEGKIFFAILEGMNQTIEGSQHSQDFHQGAYSVSEVNPEVSTMKRRIGGGLDTGIGTGPGLKPGDCYEVNRVRCWGGFCWPISQICCIRPDGLGRNCFDT